MLFLKSVTESSLIGACDESATLAGVSIFDLLVREWLIPSDVITALLATPRVSFDITWFDGCDIIFPFLRF